MEVTIVTNGNIENMDLLKFTVENSDYVICADGAAKYLMDINIYPNLLVGDLDSINKDALQWIEKGQIKIEKFPARKDMTDTELAVDFALKQSPEKINIIGAIGSRMDHSLANIMLLYKIHKMGVDAKIVNHINSITITSSALKLNCKIGQTISIIPIGGDVKGITLDGLEYPLVNHNIDIGSSLGVSNRSVKDKISISIKKGTLLVVKVHSEG